MKEKIYFWLSVLIFVLFMVIIYLTLISSLWDYILVKLPVLIFLLLGILAYLWNIIDGWTKNKNILVLNIVIWLLTPFLFNYHQSLSSIILIIFFSLHLFMFSDNKEKWWLKIAYYIFFSILFILSIWNTFLMYEISTTQIIMSYIINLSFLFVLIFWNWKFIKKSILFYTIHLSIFLYCFVLYKNFLFPFRWFEKWGMIPLFLFLYYITLFCYITSIWNMIFFSLEKKKEELKN